MDFKDSQCVQSRNKTLILHNNYNKCGQIFTSFSVLDRKKRYARSNKDFCLIWSDLLHYLLKSYDMWLINCSTTTLRCGSLSFNFRKVV